MDLKLLSVFFFVASLQLYMALPQQVSSKKGFVMNLVFSFFSLYPNVIIKIIIQKFIKLQTYGRIQILEPQHLFIIMTTPISQHFAISLMDNLYAEKRVSLFLFMLSCNIIMLKKKETTSISFQYI